MKRTILSLNEEDLHKRDEDDGGMAAAIFKSISEQLSHHNSRFKFSSMNKNARCATMMKSLDCFKEKYDVKPNGEFILYTENLKQEGPITYLPFYMAMCL